MTTQVEELPPDAKQHRQQYVEFVLSKAAPWHREHLGRLYRSWATWNTEYFEGKLTVPYLLFTTPSNPRRFGDCGQVSGFGGRGQIRIRESLLTGSHPHMRAGKEYAEGRFLLVQDVFLHESIHQLAQEHLGQPEDAYHGHGPEFARQCNRIGRKLGLPPVRDCKARGKNKELPSCSYWPHCVRPDEFYMGAYVRPAKEAKDEPPKSGACPTCRRGAVPPAETHLAEREAASMGPRGLKTPGTPQWAWQTLSALKRHRVLRALAIKQYDDILEELKSCNAWELVPPGNPYGSLEAMLAAEFGEGVEK